MESEVKKKGKTKKQIRRINRIRIIVSAVVVVAIAFLIVVTAAQRLGNMTISSMTSDVKAYFLSIGIGDGFPYEIKADSVDNMKINNSNILFLLNNKTMTLTSTAKEIMPQSHNYSNPAMKTKGSKMIVYDLDSGKFRVQSSSEIIKEYELDYNITAAAVGKKGNYAVGTYGENVQSVLTVYDKSHNEEFVWNFKTERIADISLSDNGEYAAVAVVGANNGTMYSKLYVFNFNSTEYVSCFDYDETTLVRVDYINSENIVAIGNNLRSYITNNTQRKDVSFASDLLHNYCVTDNGRTALVLSKYGSTSLSSLTVYSNENVQQFTVTFGNEMKWIDCDNKYTAVLFDNEVKTFNKNGEQIGSITFSGDPLRVLVDGNKTYVLTSVSVNCYKTRGTTNDK